MTMSKKMSTSRIACALVLVFAAWVAANAQTEAVKDWTIADYLKNLPKKYKTFSGDFLPPTKHSTNIDEENGYAAYFDSPQPGTSSFSQKSPIFEMALFKSETKPPILVVSNLISDSVCSKYETFFLRRVGSKWTEVKSGVLPPLDLKMFWDAPQSAARLLKIIKASSTSYQLEPPRRGTRMKLSLEICDYLEDDTPEQTAKEFTKLIESAKPVYLNWDKQKGKFKLTK